MKRNIVKLVGALAVGAALVFGMVGCSTFPKVALANNKQASYEILGFIGRDFADYSAAFTAAQKAYPDAQGVIEIDAVANNKLIPQSLMVGYYAVKFTLTDKAKSSGLTGLFSKKTGASSDSGTNTMVITDGGSPDVSGYKVTTFQATTK
jgi:hypothetical protein